MFWARTEHFSPKPLFFSISNIKLIRLAIFGNWALETYKTFLMLPASAALVSAADVFNSLLETNAVTFDYNTQIASRFCISHVIQLMATRLLRQ